MPSGPGDDKYKDYVRSLETGGRHALAWIGAQPRGLIAGSLHLKDGWSADADALEVQLRDFEAVLQRMREISGATVEVALGGDWNIDRADLETEASERAAVLADFLRRRGLEVRAEAHGADQTRPAATGSWTTG